MKKLAVLFSIVSLIVLTGCGRLSNVDGSKIQAPEQPSVLSAKVDYGGQLQGLGISARLNWKVENSNVAGVVIRRSTTSFPKSVTEGVLVVQAPSNITSYTDQGLSINVTYNYSLWTYNSSDQFSEKFLTTSVYTAKPQEGAVFAMSSTHVPGILSVENIVEVSWYAYAASGIAGYSFLWSKSPTVDPDTVIDTTKNSTVSPPLADGVWYFHIKAKNNAEVWGSTLHYGPFYINSGTIAIPAVSITNSNPAISTSESNWTSRNLINIVWTTDLADTNVAGYSYEFSSISDTDPDNTSEGAAKSLSISKADGVWYFHIKSQNTVGEWGNAIHYGPFRIDSSIPATPGVQQNIVFTNMDPAVGDWTVKNIVTLKWRYVGTDAITGYSYTWDKSATTIPGTVSNGLATQATSSVLSDGQWYFHIRAKNLAGQWSQSTHCGPFMIDTAVPQQISNLLTAPSDGAISFKWDYPLDSTVAGAVVVRNSSHFPTSVADGLVVFSDNASKFTDINLVNNTNYYYTIWTVDGAGNFSQPYNTVQQAFYAYADLDAKVDSIAIGDQRNSRMTKFSDSSFVVVYLNKYTTLNVDTEQLYAEAYDQNATKTASNIRLNVGQPINSDYAVSSLTNGNFVVVWSVNSMDIYAQIFNKAGASVVGATRVSSVATYDQRKPAVTALSDGNFVVAWEAGIDNTEGGWGPDGSGKSVQAKIYYSNLTEKKAEWQVNQWTYHHQKRPSIASYGGGFVIVWESKRKDSVDSTWGGYGIAARRYANSGVALADEVLVNDMKYKDQKYTRVVGLAGGGYAIVWQSGDNASPPTFFNGICAKVYDSLGVATGTEFIVRNALSDAAIPIDTLGTGTPFDDTLNPNMVSITDLTDGGFVIAYDNINGVDKDGSGRGDATGVFTRRYSATGTAVGGETQINRYCIGDQKEPQVIGLSSGGYYTVWESKGQNEAITYSGVYGRKL